MFMSFISGLIFGAGSGYFEKMIAAPLRKHLSLPDTELGILSFGGLMLIASILVSAMGINSSAFWLVLGGTLGAFAIRSFVFGKSKMEERKLAAQNAASELGDDVSDIAGDAKDSVSNAMENAKEAAKDTASKASNAAKDVVEPA